MIALTDLATTLNTYGLLGLAMMHVFELWWTKRHRAQNHNELIAVRKDVSSVKEDVNIVKGDVGEARQDIKLVKRSVDGPLGTALQGVANALGIAAKATGSSDLILQTVAAQKVADEHSANMKAIEEAARIDQESKAKIIAEWKASQHPPIP